MCLLSALVPALVQMVTKVTPSILTAMSSHCSQSDINFFFNFLTTTQCSRWSLAKTAELSAGQVLYEDKKMHTG